MNSIVKKAGLGIALAATALTAAAPADAQRYYRGGGWHHRGGGNGTAVVAGIAGLAVGAALASSSRDRYYDRGYYRGGGYGYYDRGYYPRGYYRDYRECHIERRWDPYYGEPVQVRVCY